MSTLFQVSSLPAFLEGIYETSYTFEVLAQKGNFGLGTLNYVNGEMIAVDGYFYRIDKEGHANLIPPQECTPFAMVSHFVHLPSFDIKNVANLQALNQLLDTHLTTPNIFHMIRIDGEMETLELRSEACHLQTGQPLSIELPKAQHSFTLHRSTGTLAVTYSPQYAVGFTIPGYHYHYIDEKRITGGHVFDLTIKRARVTINPIRNYEVALPKSRDFDLIKLNVNIFDALKKIE